MDDVIKTKNTYSKIYAEYAKSNSSLNETVSKQLDKFISLLSGKLVLDVGCAAGRESKYLFQNGLIVTGCDFSEEFINLAKENCPDCRFEVCDMRHLAYPDNSFDGLWVSASFLHIPKEDAQKTLNGFSKILKENGILYLSVMQGDFNGLRGNKQMGWEERHFSDYTIDELKKLLVKTNLKILEEEVVQTSWGPTFIHIFAKKTQ